MPTSQVSCRYLDSIGGGELCLHHIIAVTCSVFIAGGGQESSSFLAPLARSWSLHLILGVALPWVLYRFAAYICSTSSAVVGIVRMPWCIHHLRYMGGGCSDILSSVVNLPINVFVSTCRSSEPFTRLLLAGEPAVLSGYVPMVAMLPAGLALGQLGVLLLWVHPAHWGSPDCHPFQEPCGAWLGW